MVYLRQDDILLGGLDDPEAAKHLVIDVERGDAVLDELLCFGFRHRQALHLQRVFFTDILAGLSVLQDIACAQFRTGIIYRLQRPFQTVRVNSLGQMSHKGLIVLGNLRMLYAFKIDT